MIKKTKKDWQAGNLVQKDIKNVKRRNKKIKKLSIKYQQQE